MSKNFPLVFHGENIDFPTRLITLFLYKIPHGSLERVNYPCEQRIGLYILENVARLDNQNLQDPKSMNVDGFAEFSNTHWGDYWLTLKDNENHLSSGDI